MFPNTIKFACQINNAYKVYINTDNNKSVNQYTVTTEMENINYMSTSFQNDHTSAPLYDLATNPCTQPKLSPNKTPQEDNNKPYEPELSDYSHLSHSRPSTQNLLKTDYHSVADQQSMYASTQLYDTVDQIPFNQQPRVSTTKSKQSVQYTIGKAPLVIIIILLVLIIVLQVGLVGLVVLHFTQKDSCTSDTSSNSAGLNSGNTAVYNLSLMINNKIGNNSWLLHNILEHCATKNNLSLLEDQVMEQINYTTNSNRQLMDNIMEQIMVHDNTTSRSAGTILQLLNTSLIKDISIPTAATVNDILLVVNELLELQNGSSLFNSIRPVSCKDIKAVQPNSPTGYYRVNIRNIYCNMERLCSTEGGWTRLAYLDMSDNTLNCPSGLQAWFTGGIRVCRRQGNNYVGCRSIKFPTNGISYTQICGRVIGYQKGSTDGVNTGTNNINDAYIDGVSITRGSPREHVWSYISGISSNTNSSHGCPCNTGVNASSNKVQQFVGENYYCESGTYVNDVNNGTLYTDPLWDGNDCLSEEAPCCSSPNMLPWFFRDYGNDTSTDYLELRVCGDEGRSNEDTPVQLYEIYVK